jgi:hypothetical protein
MKQSGVLLALSFVLSSCQLSGGNSSTYDLAGKYPTAIHDVAVEFNNTIPKDPKFDNKLIAEVKAVAKKFERENIDKVFVNLHYTINYTNKSFKFCPLTYSWGKKTKIVLLETEGDCEIHGDIPHEKGLKQNSNVDKKIAQQNASVNPSAGDKHEAVAKSESFFLKQTPEAEITVSKYVGTHGNYGEVEISFVKRDSGDTLACDNLYGYEFQSEKSFLIEYGSCKPK